MARRTLVKRYNPRVVAHEKNANKTHENRLARIGQVKLATPLSSHTVDDFAILQLQVHRCTSLPKPSIVFNTSAVTGSLSIKQDGWFIFSTFYPWINPFSDQGTPPTLEETARSAEFLCRPAEEQAARTHGGCRKRQGLGRI